MKCFKELENHLNTKGFNPNIRSFRMFRKHFLNLYLFFFLLVRTKPDCPLHFHQPPEQQSGDSTAGLFYPGIAGQEPACILATQSSQAQQVWAKPDCVVGVFIKAGLNSTLPRLHIDSQSEVRDARTACCTFKTRLQKLLLALHASLALRSTAEVRAVRPRGQTAGPVSRLRAAALPACGTVSPGSTAGSCPSGKPWHADWDRWLVRAKHLTHTVCMRHLAHSTFFFPLICQDLMRNSSTFLIWSFSVVVLTL